MSLNAITCWSQQCLGSQGILSCRELTRQYSLGLSGIELKTFCENERKLDAKIKALEREERICFRELEVQKNKQEADIASAIREIGRAHV